MENIKQIRKLIKDSDNGFEKLEIKKRIELFNINEALYNEVSQASNTNKIARLISVKNKHENEIDKYREGMYEGTKIVMDHKEENDGPLTDKIVKISQEGELNPFNYGRNISMIYHYLLLKFVHSYDNKMIFTEVMSMEEIALFQGITGITAHTYLFNTFSSEHQKIDNDEETELLVQNYKLAAYIVSLMEIVVEKIGSERVRIENEMITMTERLENSERKDIGFLMENIELLKDNTIDVDDILR